ncbi:Gfo/Idh/MocA family oxidoreductase [Lapillicoccus sp.]|uniref:Gfo/Idh/MocA family protein n=1 Tax=Lapillicoccus sp. TaxID=1909287 RepID=UPI0032649A3A
MSRVSPQAAAAVGAAVIGTGFISGLHIDALRRIGVPLRGVLTRDAPAARESGLYPHVYADIDELCADPSVDVVHVTSPNNLHAEQVHQVLSAGKHVICEKPLALDASSGEAMLDAARAAGVIHAICFNVRFNPVLHHARSMIAAGDIGVPRLVSGSYLQDWLLLETDWNWRVDPEASGRLRAVADIGSHWLDLASFLTGTRVAEVFADLHTFLPTRRRPVGSVETFTAHTVASVEREDFTVTTEDAAGILLRFQNGARGALTVSQVSPGRKNSCRIEVAGSTSGLAWDSEEPERLWVGHRGALNEVLLRDPSIMSTDAVRVSHYPGGHPEGFAESFLGLVEAVYAAVVDGDHRDDGSYPTFADGVEGLRLEDAVLASHDNGRWAPVQRSTS